MDEPATRLVCSGCGAVASPADPYPFRCPAAAAGDDVDHVLRRTLDVEALKALDARSLFLAAEANPFRRYRQLMHAYQVGRAGGLSDDDYLGMVDALDEAIAGVDGRGFHETPLDRYPALERALAVAPAGAVWVKDETGNVSGSHKARHLVGILLWLRVMEALGRIDAAAAARRELAIASCGNAALAAAVVAAAAGESLDVFVPPEANPAVLEKLERHGARLTPCPRRKGEAGDPCYHRFREAVRRGWLPFTVQGPDNGLTLDGGATLGYELVSRWLRSNGRVDRLFVQVGGGALASSCAQALLEAHALGLLGRVPRIHAVQTEGGHPLWRAYQGVARRILGTVPSTSPFQPPAPETVEALREAGAARIQEALHHAATHRSQFMWPWETAPRSIATGILDDETYDWLAIVGAMLRTGGFPVVAREETVRKAHAVARERTPVAVEPTGTAGLAGWMALRGAGHVAASESVAVLFTGAER